MKILMLSWEYPPVVTGGLGRHVAELAPALAQLGVEVHVVAPQISPPQPTQRLSINLTVHWVDTQSVNPNDNIFDRTLAVNELMDARATQLWREGIDFDLIHAHDWLVGIAAIELKLRHKCPLVATIHATERGRWRNNILPNSLAQSIDRMERNLSFEAWRVIACSGYMVGELGQFFALPPDKIDMIPNGVSMKDVNRFSSEELVEFRAKYAHPSEPLIFSVGRIVYEKGFQVLLDAMPIVTQKFPNAKLVIAGKGAFIDQLRAQSSRLNLSDNVDLLGFITDDERDKFLSVANCAVFPSLYEPFGIVALEAMTFGCPVIASEVGGLAEVVTHDKTGTLVYPNNSDSTAWGIIHVLQNPDLAKNYAENAKRMAIEQYNWLRIAHQTYELVYRRVAAERDQILWD